MKEDKGISIDELQEMAMDADRTVAGKLKVPARLTLPVETGSYRKGWKSNLVEVC